MKKQWISVKCGLSRDPQHRRRMGKAVWTFLHMLDLADWESGVVYDWKDENAAEDMGIDIRVLREDRRKLDEEGYISCRQKQYGQDITIHNWTNPREYSGEVYNKKQGDKKLPPSNNVQGDAQGDAQGSVKDVIPTLDSNIKESKPDLVDLALQQKFHLDAIQQATDSFERELGVGSWAWDSTPELRRLKKFVVAEYEKDPQVWRKYREWREGNGKYDAMSNTKIRLHPGVFVDTGYPTFAASFSMYGAERPKQDSGRRSERLGRRDV